MYTQCRGCGEVFVVEVDHLIHARGQVRCNLCGTVFDGLETLSAHKPHEDEDLLLHDFDNAPPLLTQSFVHPHLANTADDDLEEEVEYETEFEPELGTELGMDLDLGVDLQLQPNNATDNPLKTDTATSATSYQQTDDVAAELDDIIAQAMTDETIFSSSDDETIITKGNSHPNDDVVIDDVSDYFVTNNGSPNTQSSNQSNNENGFEHEGEQDDQSDVEFDDEASEADFFTTEKRPTATPKKTNWLFAGLAATMFLGLLWQVQAGLASGRIKLPDHALSEQLCDWAGCAEVVEAVDLNAISLVSRNIRPHPGRDQSLIISASMINANKNSQRFPALEIKLSDLNGQILGMRRFIDHEYVPKEVISSGFVANTLIPINLEIVSPGDDAVAFEIGFVQP